MDLCWRKNHICDAGQVFLQNNINWWVKMMICADRILLSGIASSFIKFHISVIFNIFVDSHVRVCGILKYINERKMYNEETRHYIVVDKYFATMGCVF